MNFRVAASEGDEGLVVFPASSIDVEEKEEARTEEKPHEEFKHKTELNRAIE